MLLLTGCDGSESQPSFSYLALGDSYTIGQSVEEDQRWPVQLAAELGNQGVSVRPPIIVARTGWTTTALMNAIENDDNLGNQYDMVSLLIGVNNQFQGRSVESFVPEFEALLQRSIRLAGNNPQRVFVLSIPDYGVTLFGSSRGPFVSRSIDEYNAVVEATCKEYQVRYFNITPISREAASDLALLASDNLHPSGKMYKRWVDLIAADVKQLLIE